MSLSFLQQCRNVFLDAHLEHLNQREERIKELKSLILEAAKSRKPSFSYSVYDDALWEAAVLEQYGLTVLIQHAESNLTLNTITVSGWGL